MTDVMPNLVKDRSKFGRGTTNQFEKRCCFELFQCCWSCVWVCVVLADASPFALGAVFVQYYAAIPRVICYANWTRVMPKKVQVKSDWEKVTWVCLGCETDRDACSWHSIRIFPKPCFRIDPKPCSRIEPYGHATTVFSSYCEVRQNEYCWSVRPVCSTSEQKITYILQLQFYTNLKRISTCMRFVKRIRRKLLECWSTVFAVQRWNLCVRQNHSGSWQNSNDIIRRDWHMKAIPTPGIVVMIWRLPSGRNYCTRSWESCTLVGRINNPVPLQVGNVQTAPWEDLWPWIYWSHWGNENNHFHVNYKEVIINFYVVRVAEKIGFE